MRPGRPSHDEESRIAAIDAELAVLDLEGPSVLDRVLPEMRALLETDTLLVIAPVPRGEVLDVERFHADNFGDAPELERRFRRLLVNSPRRFAWYDPVRPEPEQRNRVMEAHDVMPEDEFVQSAMYRDVLQPLALHRHRQPRVLLCDGPALLAWFGAFHAAPITARQQRLLRRFVPAMRRRLAIERRLGAAPYEQAALEVVLERLGAPAFVVGSTGRIHEHNASGRALLEHRRTEVRASLRARLRGEPAPLGFELVELQETGAPAAWLAILPAGTPDARIASAVAHAATRWTLTPQQRRVLEQVLHGHANSTIAAFFGLSERAVELHVTALLDRIGADGRAALIACVLLAT